MTAQFKSAALFPSPARLAGFVTASNTPPTSFHLKRICGILGYRTKTGFSFRERGYSISFHGEIPDLSGTPFGSAIDGYLMTSARSAEAAYRAESSPTWRDYWDGWIHGDPTHHWESDLTWRVFYRTDHLISLVGQQYTYLGGAHGNTGIQTANFAWTKDGLRSLRLAELLPTDHDFKMKLVREILADLKRQEASWPKDESIVQAIDADQFTFDERGISFYFEPYVVGSYAEGIYVSSIPWTTLGANPLSRDFLPHSKSPERVSVKGSDESFSLSAPNLFLYSPFP